MTVRRSSIQKNHPRLSVIVSDLARRKLEELDRFKKVMPASSSFNKPSNKKGTPYYDLYKKADQPLPPLSFDEKFDSMAELLLKCPANFAVETTLKQMFQTDTVILWEYQPRKRFLYSPTYNRTVSSEQGIMSQVIKTGYYKTAPVQSENEWFSQKTDAAIIPGENNVLDLPIEGKNNKVQFVVQITLGKNSEKSFAQENFELANQLVEKFQKYGSLIFNSYEILSVSSKFQVSDGVAESVCKIFCKLFGCEICYFVVYRPKYNQYLKITKDSEQDSNLVINPKELGFVMECFQTLILINTKDITTTKNYLPSEDGSENVAALCIPYIDRSEQVWVCVLKKPRHKQEFTLIDEVVLNSGMPFATRSLSYVFSPQVLDQELDLFESRLKSLLEVAEILSGVLDIDKLLPTIMDRACSLLVAERCSLFLVDSAKNELVTRFHGGLDNAIRVKIGRGIVGSCAETGEIVNIKDAYADQRFDRSVDLATGFTTRSLLCIPIYNNRGEITGVTEMINKKNNGLFDEDDEKMLMAFNVFCGISLDNARLYRASLDLTRQLRSFIEMSAALNTTMTGHNILGEILQNVRSIVNASRVTLFLCSEEDNSLIPDMSIGGTQNHGTMFAQETVSARKFMLFDHKEVLGRTQTEQLNQAIDRILAAGLDADVLVFGDDNVGFEEEEEYFMEEEGGGVLEEEDTFEAVGFPRSTSIAGGGNGSSAFASMMGGRSQSMASMSLADNRASQSSASFAKQRQDNEIICCLPLLSSENAVLGVIEISCGWKILSEDIKLLDCFSVFAAVTIERSRLKDQATLGEVGMELKNWISERERPLTSQIPSKLVISMAKLSQVLMLKFDAPEWDGIGLIKVVFAIFDLFDLMSQFGITNERLFQFLITLRDNYKKVPYHNWRHAVDTMQFVAYQLLVGGLDSVFPKTDILAVIVAALCHDVDHDGFAGSSNQIAQAPLNFLFQNQSVLETHHCSVAIDILSREECNIFANLSSDKYKTMWNTIIHLILGTDMAKHFEIVRMANERAAAGDFSTDNSDDRLLLLQLLLKCGDLSTVSRPFTMANKWVEFIGEEFYQHGDLESCPGIVYTSEAKGHANVDRAKSQIAFYTQVCLPLFAVTAKVIPKLEANLQQVDSNVKMWEKEREEE